MTTDERRARAICLTRKFEAGEGTCAPICMEQLGPVRGRCGHAVKVHADLLNAIAASDEAAGMVLQEWRDIETAPKTPVRNSPQSEWHKGREHGPVLMLAFRDKGFEKWPALVGWWEPSTECWRFLEDDGANDVQPTHWAPLLSPPPIAAYTEDGDA